MPRHSSNRVHTMRQPVFFLCTSALKKRFTQIHLALLPQKPASVNCVFSTTMLTREFSLPQPSPFKIAISYILRNKPSQGMIFASLQHNDQNCYQCDVPEFL